ncbi:MAG: thioesterase family protein [Desulfofustis sp.]
MESLTRIRTRGYHVDVYGHVNNARYLEFLEEDRWAHLEATIDLNSWAARGIVFMVVNINVNYRRAVGVGEWLRVSTGLEKIGNRSAVLKQEIRLEESEEIAADALVTFVTADKSGRPLRMEGGLREEILKLDGGIGQKD